MVRYGHSSGTDSCSLPRSRVGITYSSLTEQQAFVAHIAYCKIMSSRILLSRYGDTVTKNRNHDFTLDVLSVSFHIGAPFPV